MGFYYKDAVIEFHVPKPKKGPVDLPVRIYDVGVGIQKTNVLICEGKAGDTLIFPLMSGIRKVKYDTMLKRNDNPNADCLRINEINIRVEMGELSFTQELQTFSQWLYQDKYTIYYDKPLLSSRWQVCVMGHKDGKPLPEVPVEMRPIYKDSVSFSNEHYATIARQAGQKTKQKSAAGAMVKGAVIGKVIGGDGGAVVGAMIAKEQHEKKNNG